MCMNGVCVRLSEIESLGLAELFDEFYNQELLGPEFDVFQGIYDAVAPLGSLFPDLADAVSSEPVEERNDL